MYDKASTYTKVMIGLGYGGFFAAWSGTKQYLLPRPRVASALFVTVSLVLYIIFEILQVMIVSHLSIQLANAVSLPDADILQALRKYRTRSQALTRPLLSAWKIVFPLSAFAGLVGAGILIYAFVRSLV